MNRIILIGPFIRVLIGILMIAVIILSGLRGGIISVGLGGLALMVAANLGVHFYRKKLTTSGLASIKDLSSQAFLLSLVDILIITYAVYLTGDLRSPWVAFYVLVGVGITIMVGSEYGLANVLFASACFIVITLLRIYSVIPYGPSARASTWTGRG